MHTLRNNNLKVILNINTFCVKSVTGSNLTKLRVDNSTRKDAGKYTITASNSSGKDSADIFVSVVSCPSAPQGPLQYPGATHDTVTLAWRPPEDDGGNDVTGKEPSIKIKYPRINSIFK